MVPTTESNSDRECTEPRRNVPDPANADRIMPEPTGNPLVRTGSRWNVPEPHRNHIPDRNFIGCWSCLSSQCAWRPLHLPGWEFSPVLTHLFLSCNATRADSESHSGRGCSARKRLIGQLMQAHKAAYRAPCCLQVWNTCPGPRIPDVCLIR